MRVEVGDGSGFGGLGARGLAGEMELGLDLREGEGHGERVAEACEGVDPGTSGIAEAEQLGDLVVGFAGGVVDGAADEGVVPCAVGGAGEIEMGVTAGDDEGEGWRVRRIGPALARPFLIRTAALAFLKKDGVDVAFEMVDGDERESCAKARALA